MSWTVSQKGLLLVSIPLITQLVFGFVLANMQRDQVAAEGLANHTKEVIAQAHEVQSLVSDAVAGVRGYVITRDPAFADPYRDAARDLPDLLTRLEALVSDNPNQSARAKAVRAAGETAVEWQGEVEQLARAGRSDEAVARIRSGQGNGQLAAFRRELAAFLSEEDRLDRERMAALDRSRDELNGLLIVGGLAALACTVVVAYGFRRGITRRFAALEATAGRLAAGEADPPPLTGADEIARLDRAFRHMAAELTRAGNEIRDLYHHAPCGYHSVGPDGTMLAVNQTELRWLGYTEDEVVGRMRFADVVAPASRAAYTAGFARVREDGAVTDVQLDLVRKDGSTFPVLVNSSSVRDADGRYLRSRTTTTDMTERRRADDAVRRLNTELERRVAERTTELEAANRDLSQKNAENEMFVYSVSHDLRSPLVNLQGFSRELVKACTGLTALLAEDAVPADVRDRGQALLDGKVAKSVGFIQAAVLRLSGIIDALLRLSRAGRVDYRWEVVDMTAVAAQVVTAAHASITEREAVVRVGELPPVWGDRTAVEQVLANLIGNALTYLQPGRPGAIEVGAADAPPGFRTFFVRDNGRGIADGHQQKIFQPFQRAHPGVGNGEGLGLAIVTRAVERHGGRVWVDSRPGEGSTFSFTLPAPPAAGGA